MKAKGGSNERKSMKTFADYIYPIQRKQWKKRIGNPKELIDQAIQKDNPELIPDMYNEDAYRADMEIKEMAERWDR